MSNRERRGVVFSVAPAVLALLLVVAMAAVIRANTRDVASKAETEPVAGSLTITPAAGTATRRPSPSPTPSPPPSPSPTPVDDPALARNAVSAVDSLGLSHVELGVAVLDRVSGQVTVGGSDGADANTQFYCASVLKLFVIADLFHQQEAGTITLSAQDMSDITRALEQSDDNAMDALWERYSGPSTITQLISLAQLRDTQLPSDLSQWGETLISARDVISVYQYVFNSLNANDRDVILTDLNNAAASGADGFDQSFGLLGPGLRTSSTKAKQGWMDYGSQMMLHTTGVLGSSEQYVVAVLSLQRMSSGWSAGRSNLNLAASVLLKALGPAATQ